MSFAHWVNARIEFLLSCLLYVLGVLYLIECMKKIIVACMVILSFSSNVSSACSPVFEIPKLTFITLSEIDFSNSEKDYIEFFVNKPENIKKEALSIELDGKNIYDGFELDQYNVIEKDLVATTEQLFVKYGDEIIDAVCWKNSDISASEIDDVEYFEKLDFGECLDSEEIDKKLHISKKDLLINEWSINSNHTPGRKNDFILIDPQAVIEVQSGQTIGYGKVTLNLDGSSSLDQNGLDLSFKWDFGNGQKSEKANPDLVIFEDVGSYTIELEVENSLGANDSDYIYVTVLPDNNDDIVDESTDVSVDEEIVESLVDLSIYDFMPNPEGSDTGNEWVDVLNLGEPGYGFGWYLDDREGQSEEFHLDQIYFETGSVTRVYNSLSKIGLNNTDDAVRLIKDHLVLDEIIYEETKSGVSYLESNIVGGEDNNEETKDLDYELSNDLSINELMPNPEGSDTGNEWVEILNKGESLTLRGWYLMLNNKKVTLDEMELTEDGFLVVEVKGFANSSGTVGLYDPNDNLMDEVDYEKSLEGQSYSLSNNEWIWTEYITKNYANVEILESQGYVTIIDKIEQIIGIDENELFYKDLPDEIKIGDMVEYKYLENDLLDIKKNNTNDIPISAGFVNKANLEKDIGGKVWIYLVLYGLASIIAVYFRKPLWSFVKTKFAEI